VSVGADRVARVIEIAARWGVPVARVGRTGGDRLQIVIEGRVVVDVAVADAAKAWSEGLPTLLKGSTCAPT
jgi:phosphoribosylformylglycinamidine (FGAM) synthase-like enzyme